MARGLKKVMLIGNLGADPEIKYAPSGTAIANLRIATTESRKNNDGDWEDKTEWHRVVMFGRQAEVCKDYLSKGSKIFLEGRLQTRSWDDQNGQKHYSTEVIGTTFIMLDSKGKETSKGTASQGKTAHDPGNMPELSNDDIPVQDDDLPF